MQVGSRFIPQGVFVGLFIPNAIAQCKNLQLSSKLIWGRLSQYAGGAGDCYPKVSSVAKELGCGVRTVQRGIKELCKEGFLEIEAVFNEGTGSQTTNRYHFLWHEIFELSLKRQTPDQMGCQNGTPEDAKKSCLGVTEKSSTPGAKKSPKEIQSLKENQEKRTTNYTGGSCLSDEVEKAIKIIAPTKDDPDAWEAKMRILGRNGGLDLELLENQAEKVLRGGTTKHRSLVEKIIERDGVEVVTNFIEGVTTPMVEIEGVSVDVSFIRGVLSNWSAARRLE